MHAHVHVHVHVRMRVYVVHVGDGHGGERHLGVRREAEHGVQGAGCRVQGAAYMGGAP